MHVRRNALKAPLRRAQRRRISKSDQPKTGCERAYEASSDNEQRSELSRAFPDPAGPPCPPVRRCASPASRGGGAQEPKSATTPRRAARVAALVSCESGECARRGPARAAAVARAQERGEGRRALPRALAVSQRCCSPFSLFLRSPVHKCVEQHRARTGTPADLLSPAVSESLVFKGSCARSRLPLVSLSRARLADLAAPSPRRA